MALQERTSNSLSKSGKIYRNLQTALSENKALSLKRVIECLK
jgi:hypothetical protein